MVVSALVNFVDRIWRDRRKLVFVYNDLDYRIGGNPDVDLDGIFSADLSKTDAGLFAGSGSLKFFHEPSDNLALICFTSLP